MTFHDKIVSKLLKACIGLVDWYSYILKFLSYVFIVINGYLFCS